MALAGRSHVGHVRDNNEDALGHVWCPDDSLLAVVCDGMGGHQAGEVASRIAVETLQEQLANLMDPDPRPRLEAALLHANESIIAHASEHGQRGMGTTAITAFVRGDRAYVALIGDSRAYHVRGGRVLTRTRDHTRVESRIQMGEITEAEARDHPESGILTRALGHRKMANRQPLRADVLPEPLALRQGDALVLSSDGLHDLVEDDEIAEIVAGLSPADAAERLVALALDRGGHDNVTVIVITAGERAAPPASVPAPMGGQVSAADQTGPTLAMEAHGASGAATRVGVGPDDQGLAMLAALVVGVLALCGSVLALFIALTG